MATTRQAAATRTLEVVRNDGTKFRLTIPATAKVTYAPVMSPGGKRDYQPYDSPSAGCALRIYEGTQNNQRALFRGIASFRDLSYELVEEIVAVEEHTEADSKGNRKGQRKVERDWEEK